MNDHGLWRNGTSPGSPNMYGHMYAWGIWLGYEMAKDAAITKGVAPIKAGFAYLATALGGIVGAKALNIAQFHEQMPNLSEAFLRSGGTWYGGALGGLATLYLYAKAAKVSFAKLTDALTPGGLIGLGIGRIGCWSAGCCSGEIAGLPAEPISALFDIGLGLTLSRYLKTQPVDGKTSLVGLACYALFRFTMEVFRHEPSVLGNLTLSQLISLGILTGTGILYSKLAKTPPKIETPLEAKINAPVPSPKEKFILRTTELALLTPILWSCQPMAAKLIATINVVRAAKEAIKWLKNKFWPAI